MDLFLAEQLKFFRDTLTEWQARVVSLQSGERQAFADGPRIGDERIERSAHLTRIARHFRHALLVVVELFQRHHRQIDVVFLEAEKAGRVVHEHVRVEHEKLLDFGALFRMQALFRARARAPARARLLMNITSLSFLD